MAIELPKDVQFVGWDYDPLTGMYSGALSRKLSSDNGILEIVYLRQSDLAEAKNPQALRDAAIQDGLWRLEERTKIARWERSFGAIEEIK